ncbi:MAG: 4-hydroxy-tetrahydrodipicolinate reductase [Deltaproteobacteria bacterium]|nr:4-hydroxy-tetrahydrodipicolinate reductase [Deltaproteobacteria bacterium]
MIKAVVTGATGRMGARIINIIRETPGIELSGALEREGHPAINKDAGIFSGCGAIGIPITSSLAGVIHGADVVIDFTSVEASLVNVRVCSEAGKGIVIGSTGFTTTQVQTIKDMAEKIPCVLSANMSVGVNVLMKVLKDAARILGDDYDVEIVEAHHRLKKDAPSGTAMMLGRAVADALGRNLDEVGVYARHGIIGERTQKEIGIQTIRGGDIVGDHTVYFAGIGERLEFTHRAHTRDNFAKGAVRAALWLAGKELGLYDMQDVLGLR